MQALFYYVWLEEPPARKNFETVLELLSEAEVTDKNKPSGLDLRMKFLEQSSSLGASHPAVKQYRKCMRGAGDTVRSIIISANSRLAFLENKQVLRILSRDDLHLEELGVGVNGDGETKTALFCVIPDSDKSYNFIIGMLYTQIFQELYYQADFLCEGRLPIHVTFMMDEFANVALPDDYCSLLSTMRSREISSVIIIQNFAQLKALFKDTWETIPGNCDTFIYLGGNEQSTHKYVSELLGKGTIDKKTTGDTRGRQGSSSRNYDVLGRELFLPDEVRKLDNKKCFIFIRGFDPIMDEKYNPFKHPLFALTADGKGEPYVHQNKNGDRAQTKPYQLLSPKAVAYFETLKKQGEPVYIDNLSYEDLKKLSEADVRKRFLTLEEQAERRQLQEEEQNELQYAQEKEREKQKPEEGQKKATKRKIQGEDNLVNRVTQWIYTTEQRAELRELQRIGMPKEDILTFFYPETDVEQMKEIRKTYEAMKKKEGETNA